MFENINGILHFDGCNTQELARRYGTPLYVVAENEIIYRCQELKEQFLNKYYNTRAAYAGKAFLTIGMCKIIEREGLCLDVVSGGELFTAIKAGFPPHRIEFNGNNKSIKEIEEALDYNVGRFIVDSIYELTLLESICKRKEKKIDILFRINPDVRSNHTHIYNTTATKESKFGIPINDEILYPAIEQCINSDYLTILGLHFHIGSQIFESQTHLKALEVSLAIMKNVIEKYNYIFTELNIGGGFGIKYTDMDIRKSYSFYLDSIMERVTAFSKELDITRPTITIEPGRSIVGEAGITLYTVGTIKNIPDLITYVSIDGGITDNIRPALYQAQYNAVIANRMDDPKLTLVTICGKCCESGDVLIKDIYTSNPQAGDICAVYSTGAYGYSMSNNYNKNTIPAVVMVKDGAAALMVKRQTYEDLIERETNISVWEDII